VLKSQPLDSTLKSISELIDFQEQEEKLQSERKIGSLEAF